MAEKLKSNDILGMHENDMKFKFQCPEKCYWNRATTIYMSCQEQPSALMAVLSSYMT